MYCIEMERSNNEFWHSTFSRVMTMIDMYTDKQQMKAAAINNEYFEPKYFKQKEEVKVIKSMKEIEGW